VILATLSTLAAAGTLAGCVSLEAQCSTSTALVEGRVSRSTRCAAGLLMFETAPAVEVDDTTPLECCKPGGP
jgi:hypothetical protein